MAIKQAEQRITALYERLSRDDELAGGEQFHFQSKIAIT